MRASIPSPISKKGVDDFALEELQFQDLTLKQSHSPRGTIVSSEGHEKLVLVEGVYDLVESDSSPDILIT
jgi:hypothetical protein